MHSTTDHRTATVAGTWVVDPAASAVAFAVKHLKVATVHGRFARFAGTVRLDEDLAGGTAGGAVDLASVATGDPKRDEILRGADFFDVAAFPQLTFAATGWRGLSAHRFEVTGDLTIRDSVRRVVLAAELGRVGPGADGRDELDLTAHGVIDRTGFGMPFDHNASSALIGRQVELSLSLTLRRQEG